MPHVIEKIEIESTSDDAKDLARAGCEAFSAIWAHRQTKGRGQYDRVWKSHEGSVFWSVVLRPDARWHRHTDIIYVMSLAIITTLDPLLNDKDRLKLKWPNDTMLDGRKLGGTLTEASGPYRKLSAVGNIPLPDWVVSGTGINVVPVDDVPGMVYPPTSLQQAGYLNVGREDIIPRMIDAAISEVEFWVEHGFEPVRQRYLERTFGLNTLMKVGINPTKTEYREGIYRGITPEGAIMLEDEHGVIKFYSSGEIIRNDTL